MLSYFAYIIIYIIGEGVWTWILRTIDSLYSFYVSRKTDSCGALDPYGMVAKVLYSA